MRDPKRIARICKILQKVWTEVPDQRLGQLLANYAFGHHRDIFYQEDDRTEETLNGIYKQFLAGKAHDKKDKRSDTKADT